MFKKFIGLALVFTIFLSTFTNSYASVNLNASNEKDFMDMIFDAEEGDKVTFGRWYESGIDNGSNVDKNKMIPLKWTVVAGDSGEFIDEEKGECKMAYIDLVCDYVVNKMQFAVNENGSIKNGSWDYHNSNVKQWLNSHFYNNAFSADEKKYIDDSMPSRVYINKYMKNEKISTEQSLKHEELLAKVNIPGIYDLEYFGVEIGKNKNDKWDIFYNLINDRSGEIVKKGWDFDNSGQISGTTLRVWNSKGERADYSYWLADVGNTEYTTRNGDKIKHPCVYVEGNTFGLVNGYIAENNGAIFGLFDADRYNSTPQPKIAEQISPDSVHGVRPMIMITVKKYK